MNYKIPKNREEARQIFNKIMDDYDRELVDIVPNKYMMFVGALTECSDEEFKYYVFHICNICESVDYAKHCINKIDCVIVHKNLFSKHWNE